MVGRRRADGFWHDGRRRRASGDGALYGLADQDVVDKGTGVGRGVVLPKAMRVSDVAPLTIIQYFRQRKLFVSVISVSVSVSPIVPGPRRRSPAVWYRGHRRRGVVGAVERDEQVHGFHADLFERRGGQRRAGLVEMPRQT